MKHSDAWGNPVSILNDDDNPAAPPPGTHRDQEAPPVYDSTLMAPLDPPGDLSPEDRIRRLLESDFRAMREVFKNKSSLRELRVWMARLSAPSGRGNGMPLAYRNHARTPTCRSKMIRARTPRPRLPTSPCPASQQQQYHPARLNPQTHVVELGM